MVSAHSESRRLMREYVQVRQTMEANKLDCPQRGVIDEWQVAGKLDDLLNYLHEHASELMDEWQRGLH